MFSHDDDGRELADARATRAQKVPRPFQHGAGFDHVLEDVVHGDHVVLPEMIGQIGCLEGSFQHVIAPGPPFGRDLRLDLDPCAFQIEEPPELVEVPAVAGSDVEERPGRSPIRRP